MNIKEIRELIDLITEKGITEFELERGGARIRIRRGGEARREEALTLAGGSAATAGGAAAGASGAAVATTAAPATEELYVVRAPMVGTFYSAPGQDAAPFVQVGDRVRVGQVLCIIEAMKLMNEIESEIDGEIVKCYVENGQPVEFGEPLFDVRPAISAKR